MWKIARVDMSKIWYMVEKMFFEVNEKAEALEMVAHLTPCARHRFIRPVGRNGKVCCILCGRLKKEV